MPIIKTIMTGNGNAGAARIEKATLQSVMGAPGEPFREELQLEVRLFPALADARTGANLIWQLYPSLPVTAYDPADPFGSLERALIAAPGDFSGGTYTPKEVVSTLDDAKAAKWSEIKAERDRLEGGGFDLAGVGRFDSDAESRARIVGAAMAGKIARDAAQPYSINWTLADNTTVTLDADGVINVGFALLSHVDGIHQRSRALYAQIQAAQTAEVVAAIRWEQATGVGGV